MLIYLGVSAVVAFGLSVALGFSGRVAPAAAAHVAFAAGVMPLIFGAMAHFITVLTRSAAAPRPVLLLPLVMQAAGVCVAGVLLGLLPAWVLHAAAASALAATLAFIAWQVKRARVALGKPHPGWRWYPAALACLALALASILAGLAWPQGYHLARVAHLHLNTLGFVGLAAIGTLNVLLPTVLNRPDAQAVQRLRQALPLALAGVVLVAAGGVSKTGAIAGGALLALVAGRLWLGWMRSFGPAPLLRDGAAVSLLGALTGFLVLLVAGAAHGMGAMDSAAAVPAFIILFLLPLVTGALSQLVPVWRFPGAVTPARQALRARLARGGGLRCALFLAGGIGVLAGAENAYWLALAGILLFAVELLHGLVRQRGM